MDTQNLQNEIRWPLYERNFLKIFLLIEEFSDDSALVEASSSKDDEILFFLLISNKELKEKAMPYKKHLRQLKCKREEKFSD